MYLNESLTSKLLAHNTIGTLCAPLVHVTVHVHCTSARHGTYTVRVYNMYDKSYPIQQKTMFISYNTELRENEKSEDVVVMTTSISSEGLKQKSRRQDQQTYLHLHRPRQCLGDVSSSSSTWGVCFVQHGM